VALCALFALPFALFASQTDYNLANQTMPNARTDINNIYDSILTNNSGTTSPTTTQPYMLWSDTTANLMKMRNAADSAWISIWNTTTGAVSAVGSSVVEWASESPDVYPGGDGENITDVRVPVAAGATPAGQIGDGDGQIVAWNGATTYPTGDGSAITNVSSAFRGVLVDKASVLQTITNATNTPLTWTSEQYDTDNIHDNAVNNTRLTVPAGVTKVRIWGKYRWDNSNSGERRGSITKNGLFTYVGMGQISDAAHDEINITQTQTAILTVTNGDYFEFQALQSSGASLGVQGSVAWFCMEIIE